MTDSSRPALRVVPEHPPEHPDAPPGVAEAIAAGPTTARVDVRPDPVALLARIDAEVARRRRPGGARLRSRWDAVRRAADPDGLERLAAHAASLHEAADAVRRQHTETAEDLGPLWDSWAGPAAEAVQDRVSALARSAQALVVELESTAGRLADAHDRVVQALEDLADDLAAEPLADPAACDRAAAACGEAWQDARRVLAGGGTSGLSGFGPRFP